MLPAIDLLTGEAYNYQPFYDIVFNRIPKPTTIKYRKDGNFYLAVGLCKGDILSLNSIAGEILSYCDGIRTIGDIKDILREKYPEVETYRLYLELCTCRSDLDNVGAVTIQSMSL